MPLPSGVKVELEFTAGVWTDVTADVDGSGFRVTVGRTSPQSQPQPGSATVTLVNPTGKYTPGVAVLSDGTAAPYYPNVQVRKRIRISNSSGVRFLGRVTAWQPSTNGFAGSSLCTVSASDYMDGLSKVDMDAPIRGEVAIDAPVFYYSLTNPDGTTSVPPDTSSINAAPLTVASTGAALTFGVDGPGSGNGTAVKFNPTSKTSGKILATGLLPLSSVGDFTFEAWVNQGASYPAWTTLPDEQAFASLNFYTDTLLTPPTQTLVLGAGPGGAAATWSDVLLVGGGDINDSDWHHLALTYDVSTGALVLYLDGVSVDTETDAAPSNMIPARLLVGAGLNNATGLSDYRTNATVGQVALYGSTLSAARIAAHASAGPGWLGETVDERIARFLGYAGISPADYTLDASTVTLGSYPQAGKDVLAGSQDMAVTEGGGSVFYMRGDKLVFRDRDSRSDTVDLTVTVGQDDDASGYQPSLDDQSLLNQVTAQRSGESGTLSEQTYTDPVSVAAFGLASTSVTTYTDSDDDALALAQSMVASNATPAWRLPKITVDFLTAQNNLYAALQNVGIGSRLRISGLPAGQAPATQVDLYVEGWTETGAVGVYQVQFDTSPADNPPTGVYDTAMYQPEDDCALNAALTNSATTVVIKSPTGPTFTTTGADYPITVLVDGERIQLNSAPGGSTSPQTFTGVTRAVDGTTAAAHAANAPVTFAPATTYAL